MYGAEKILQILPFISKTVRDRPSCYGTLIESRRPPIDPCRFQWPWVTLMVRTRRIKLSRMISVITHQPFHLQRPRSVQWHTLVRGVFLWGQTCPGIPRGGAQRPKNFEDSDPLLTPIRFDLQRPNSAW